MKIKTRFIKQTTITLSEVEKGKLIDEMVAIKNQFHSSQIPTIEAIVENLIEVQLKQDPTYLD